MIHKIYSKVKPDTLLHIIHRFDIEALDVDGRMDICDPQEPLQIAFLRYTQPKAFAPHIHVVKRTEVISATQETWIVIGGRITVDYYDIEGEELLESHKLSRGDCTITLNGGHAYRIGESDHWDLPATVYEVKSGPYRGKDFDKKPL